MKNVLFAFKGGELALWVYRYLLWGCEYDENLNAVATFLEFYGCRHTHNSL
jgi:hypothetical protein